MTHLDQTKHAHGASPDPLAHGGWVGAHWPGTLMEATGMEVLEHTAARTVISMPIDGNRQSAGILHGGASAALAETAASFAAQIHARETNPGKPAFAVGTELNASHIGAGREGTVTATATAVHLGRSSTVHTVEIRDEADRLISVARVTNRILVRPRHK
ncbi:MULTISPECIES: PaaI family thioesterase [Actinomycetes]|uniref:PaaI family thioesterase n=1 Tax=Actinomycetes TaxID=1760 RepID=UPI000661829B|nr:MULTISPECIES: hotdog fold thioesterase [Actinomycetes]MCM3898236.1 hotdog fold thioesterase [Schaalia meyeri]